MNGALQARFNRQAGSMDAAMNDKLSKLSAGDRAKLDALANDWARDGRKAIRRFAEADPLACFRIMAALHPRMVAKDLEHDLLNEGLTNADLRTMAAKAVTRH